MARINPSIQKGIEDSRRAFTGPRIVQIDLTGKCNNNCIGCWVHSPFIKVPPRDKNISLSFEKAKALIEDLVSSGTEEIYLSGAGEPFLHPQIMETIELIKSKGLRLNIITNFTAIDEKKAEKLVDSGADLLTASIWAASPAAYVKTHPGKSDGDFYKIKNNLKRLSELKAKKNKYLPLVKIYNVICNLNYNEIRQMVDFALDTQVEFVEFQIMDIIKDETSFLALTQEQVGAVKSQFEGLARHNELYFKELELFNLKLTREKELKEFPGRFIRVHPDFFLKEWIEEKGGEGKRAAHSLVCPQGNVSQLGKRNPLINEAYNKISFKFLREDCEICPRFKNACPADKDCRASFNYLAILGFGSFMRRLNSADIYEQIYEKDIIDNLPCYIGWTYSRILSTGEVIPCCKAANKPLGNIYKNNFLEVWNSGVYQEFRFKAKACSKREPYFEEINCYKSCDNLSMNLQIKDAICSAGKKSEADYAPPIKNEGAQGRERLPGAQMKIIVPAGQFDSGNLNIQEHNFGSGIVIDGGMGFGFAEYKIYFNEGGRYELWSRYASEDVRPVEIYIDGNLVLNRALSSTTAGWTIDDLCWFRETALDICKGTHNFKVYTEGLIPHIHGFAFLRGVKHSRQKSGGYSSEKIYERPSSFKLLRDKFKNTGFINSSIKLFDYVASGRIIRSYLDILGVFNGRYAFKGPFHTQIDLTYNCNNNCVGCWCNSPLLEEKALPPDVKRQTLPFGLIKGLLDELSQMGTKEIYYSGGGEPFMHPEIMEILAYTKKKGFTCYVNTNFTLLDEERIRRLIDFGIEHLTVSTWAATPRTYAETHPNKNEDTFRQIAERLKLLNSSKRQFPFIKLYNVIFNMNYHELKDMVLFAKETGSESVEFTLIDTVPGKTEKLLLNESQIKELQKSARQLSETLDSRGCLDGILLFRFDSFLRRIYSSSDLSKATYDRNIIDKIPCYIGWCFSRAMPNGDINACLKAHRIPVGNLYQDNFCKIWNDKKQQRFRKKTLVYEKRDPFFQLIGNDPGIKESGCYKSCDDIGRNIHMHNRIMSLSFLERRFLKVVSKIRKKPPLDRSLQAKSKNPVIAGILSGRKALAGPEQVVVDITNRCNERCIGCWLYSPLLKGRADKRLLNQEIDFIKAKRLIADLAELGTKRIRFTGGGEPFVHPRIMDLIRYTKDKGLICCLTTNFTRIRKDTVRELIDLGVDEISVSLWASNEETYRKTHPGTQAGSFKNIKENLSLLTQNKNEKPFVTLCNVICNLNYLELEEMLGFASDTEADGIYFTLIDTIEGATECLLLSEEQRQEVLRQADRIRQIEGGAAGQRERVKLDYFDGFVSRLEEQGSLKGNYDRERVNRIPCYAGWIFARVLADGTVCPCCRGVRKSMGNIGNQNFKDIWFSRNYDEFRARARFMPKTDPYFSEIGCIKMCDNLMHNEQMHGMIR